MPPAEPRSLRSQLPRPTLCIPCAGFPQCYYPGTLPQDLETGPLPGDTEGEGGLQRSSNSELGSQTLPSQLLGDAEALSGASVS